VGMCNTIARPVADFDLDQSGTTRSPSTKSGICCHCQCDWHMGVSSPWHSCHWYALSYPLSSMLVTTVYAWQLGPPYNFMLVVRFGVCVYVCVCVCLCLSSGLTEPRRVVAFLQSVLDSRILLHVSHHHGFVPAVFELFAGFWSIQREGTSLPTCSASNYDTV
jgi:hypothetical protein